MWLFVHAISLCVLCIAPFVASSPLSLQLNDSAVLSEVDERAPPPILPLVLQQNAALATAWLNRTKPDNLSVTYIVYPVPGTSTRLFISVWDQTLPKIHMGGVILKATNDVERHIRAHPEDRDSVLDRRDDPFWCESDPPGIIFGAWSTAPKRLTYGELGNVVLGVWKAMYQEGKYNAASIEIQDMEGGARKIGDAVIRRGRLRPSRSEN